MLFSSDEREHLEVRMRVRTELFAKIRRDARVEGLSIRGLAKRNQIGKDTVRQALSDPVPPRAGRHLRRRLPRHFENSSTKRWHPQEHRFSVPAFPRSLS